MVVWVVHSIAVVGNRSIDGKVVMALSGLGIVD